MTDAPKRPAHHRQDVRPAHRLPNESKALVSTPSADATLDAHGFDPADFEWRPVPRRPRADGWVPDVQRRFVEALADNGIVAAACQAVDMSVQSAYRLRRAPGAESFARAWDAAVAEASQRLIDMAFTRAIEGEDVPVFDRDGCRIGARRRHNDRLLMFLLRAYQPARFGALTEAPAAHRPVPAPRELPIAEALIALEPAAPAEPHLLMPPEKLAEEIDVAQALAGIDELYPADDRERYVRAPGHTNHPAAQARRAERHARAVARWDSEEGAGGCALGSP